ncbi:unnamed protein product [Mytilus edulis]|uniref:Uncharacterized protein n=1 Tax=Mytilus edulis TaxID=6550 RepID=A0A8S3Q794_MYTED|nr:unnamed protein product [Mytilus edulis]
MTTITVPKEPEYRSCELSGEKTCNDGRCISKIDLCPEEQLMNQNTILIMIVVGIAVVIFLIVLYCFQQRQRNASRSRLRNQSKYVVKCCWFTQTRSRLRNQSKYCSNVPLILKNKVKIKKSESRSRHQSKYGSTFDSHKQGQGQDIKVSTVAPLILTNKVKGQDIKITLWIQKESLFEPPPAYNEAIDTRLYPPTPQMLRDRALRPPSEDQPPMTPPPNYDTALQILAKSHESVLGKPPLSLKFINNIVI